MTATRAPSRCTPPHPLQAAMHRSAYSSSKCPNWPPVYNSRRSSMTLNTFHQPINSIRPPIRQVQKGSRGPTFT